MNIVKNNNKISTLINLLNNTDVISWYGCNGNTYVQHVDPMYMHEFTRLFIDINNSISYQASCGRVVITVDLLSGGREVFVV